MSYHYTTCGLDNIFLLNGYEEKDTAYGPAVSIKDVEGLHQTIAVGLTELKRPLTHKEFRFLRKELEMSQGALAKCLGLDEQTIGRYERAECNITGPVDRLIRALYLEAEFGPSPIKEMIERIGDLEDEIHFMINYSEGDDPHHWKLAA